MKIYIGPYRNWVGPYQLALLLRYIGFSQEICYKIGEKLSKTYLLNICEWIESRKKRKVKVKIHNYDTWNMDHTLSLIILPTLLKLRENKSGVSNVSDEDVPDDLKLNDNFEDFEAMERKWDYVLNEMIFAFESQNNGWEEQFTSGETDIICDQLDSGNFQLIRGPNDTYKIDTEARNKYQKRITNGFTLFGKYYESLWC